MKIRRLRMESKSSQSSFEKLKALKSKHQASSYSNQQLTFKQLKDFAKSTGFDGKFATKKELLQWYRAHSKNVTRTSIVKFEISTKLMSIATS